MVEIKNIEKTKKKQFVVSLILSLAIISFLIGLWDIKSNAAESSHEVTINIVQHEYLNDEIFQERNFSNNYISNSPIYIYHNEISIPQEKKAQINFHLLSKEEIVIPGTIYKSEIITDKNGVEWHWIQFYAGSENIHSGYSFCFDVDIQGAEKIYILNKYYSYNDFLTSFAIDDLDTKVDYNSFEIDDDMLIPENVKYNCIVNEYTSSPEEYIFDIYDVVSWDNTSEKYRIQIDSVPVVQYHKGSIKITSDIVNLGKKTTLIKEFLGEWKNEKIFDVVGNTFEKYQNGNNADLCDETAFDFKKECDDKYTYNRFTESSILLFGYRVRYIDIENQKASAWVYLMPMEKEWNYKAYVMYSNGTTSNEENANGLVNEYTNMEDISDGVNDIVTENIYKDKYGSSIGDVDTSQATNWLYSVVDFIKTTPSMVGTVLAFLPQPILYGMYVTIFLGCIASAIAIVKALI